jgi:hypothetical protein
MEERKKKRKKRKEMKREREREGGQRGGATWGKGGPSISKLILFTTAPGLVNYGESLTSLNLVDFRLVSVPIRSS